MVLFDHQGGGQTHRCGDVRGASHIGTDMLLVRLPLRALIRLFAAYLVHVIYNVAYLVNEIAFMRAWCGSALKRVERTPVVETRRVVVLEWDGIGSDDFEWGGSEWGGIRSGVVFERGDFE